MRPGVECAWCRTINTVGRRARVSQGHGSNPIAACVCRLFELPPYGGKFRATGCTPGEPQAGDARIGAPCGALAGPAPRRYIMGSALRPRSLPSSSGLGRRPLTAKTGVRFPLGAPSSKQTALVNGHQKIWRRVCDARFRVLDLFVICLTRKLNRLPIDETSPRWNRSKLWMRYRLCGRPSRSELGRPASVDARAQG
jgi:hypothetical protein